ncbi:hypothetical protein [Sphingobacterium lactis]|uniref:hypothetical protein n=1 Tax=Sphingobacterium lactis TaxID=797291 RepID=UPI003DA4EB57
MVKDKIREIRGALISLLLFFPIYISGINNSYSQKSKLDFKILYNLEMTSFKWNIAGNEHLSQPNILSEILVSDLSFKKYGLSFKYTCYNNCKYNLCLSYGISRKGYLLDVDYAENNRSGIYNIEKFKFSGAKVFNFGINQFYPVLTHNKLGLLLSTNISLDNYNIPIKEPSISLDSYYRTSLVSIGGSINMEYGERLLFQCVIPINISKLYSEGFWNLREDLKNPSFRQNVTGLVYGVNLALIYKIKNNKIGFKFNKKNYLYENGKDITYTKLGNITTNLNEFKLNQNNFIIFISTPFKHKL